MTYEQIAQKPLKAMWHDNVVMIVKGRDGRFFILYDDPCYKGDNAGDDIKVYWGYPYSWALGNFDGYREFDYYKFSLIPCEDSNELDLTFKKLKRFSL